MDVCEANLFDDGSSGNGIKALLDDNLNYIKISIDN